MLTIIDYNAGNIASIYNMLKKIGQKAIITSNPDTLLNAEKIIIPGVGAFDHGMGEMNRLGLSDIIREKVLIKQTPILGICLGAQLMGKSSEEGKLAGLGLIDMDVRKFDSSRLPANYKIPHMGWNYVKLSKSSKLFYGMYENPRFYFVHSYHFVTHMQSDILTTTEYGCEFVSSFQKDNIIGVQFHPEKSHKFGMQLLKNFIEM
jgi:glutamine amidotransferase